jgi:hypothetical protein
MTANSKYYVDMSKGSPDAVSGQASYHEQVVDDQSEEGVMQRSQFSKGKEVMRTIKEHNNLTIVRRKGVMNRSKLLVVLTAGLLVASSTGAIAATKTGQKCSKSQVGKVTGGLVCTKRGTTYRWTVKAAAPTSQGEVVPAKSTIPVPLIAFEPTTGALPAGWPVTAPFPAIAVLSKDGTSGSQYVFELQNVDPVALWQSWGAKFALTVKVDYPGGAPFLTVSGPAIAPHREALIAIRGNAERSIVRVNLF